MNPRINERNKLKRKMTKLKRRIATLADKFKIAAGCPMEIAIPLMNAVTEVSYIQKEINALSASIDERVLLEQSMKRIQKAKRG